MDLLCQCKIILHWHPIKNFTIWHSDLFFKKSWNNQVDVNHVMVCIDFFLKNDSYILRFYLEKNADKVMSERVEGTSQSSMLVLYTYLEIVLFFQQPSDHWPPKQVVKLQYYQISLHTTSVHQLHSPKE